MYAAIRFICSRDYPSIRRDILDQQIDEGEASCLIHIAHGFIVTDQFIPRALYKPLKRAVTHALDDYFLNGQMARKIGIEANFSAS